MRIPTVLVICVVLTPLFSGCVTGRRTFGLEIPPAKNSPIATQKDVIAIGAIVDARHFENHPSSPSTPSVNGDVDQISAAAKSTFIGRQRNGYGKAMGDITLPDGQNVQGKVAELLGEALKRRGYSIVADSAAGTAISSNVEEFWSWITPGFFALSFEARITCQIGITRNGKQVTFHVHGYGLNHGQFAKNVNWQQAYDAAFQDFLSNLNLQLNDAGL